jgi:branched-chain amino acid transport system substrate-binding protein
MLGRYQGAALFALLLGLAVTPAAAETPGITDTEIKVGQNAPFSGPASVYGQISTAETAYFKMINDQGGITAARSSISLSTTATARRNRSKSCAA